MKTTKFALIAALTISGILAPQTTSASDRVSASGAVSAPAARPSDDPAKTDTSDGTVRGGAESGNRPQDVLFLAKVEPHDAHVSGGDVSGHVTWKLLIGTPWKMQVRSSLRAQTSWFSYSTVTSSSVRSVWPGGGRGKAAVARHKCNGESDTNWYTRGEIYAPGAQKSYGRASSKIISRECGV